MARSKGIGGRTNAQPIGKIEQFGQQTWQALQHSIYREDRAHDVLKSAEVRARISRREDNLADLHEYLESRAFFTLARTPADAMMQLALIRHELTGYNVEKEEHAMYLRSMRRADRALYSLLRWVEKVHRVDRPKVLDFYMSADKDPWAMLGDLYDLRKL